ncbi:MAG TPA: nucleotidyltransferase domain-containing protein [Thermoleophilia bacterium]|nr:nucleotidyltransferase domain-containing protein [Thermoleophilia bacterium]
MNRLIEEHRDDLIRLCAKYGVRRLEVFGSGLTTRFDPRTSDLDFLVEFLPLQPGEYADAYFGLLEALRELFERNVDLVMIGAIRNRYFLESINRSRRVLYAA